MPSDPTLWGFPGGSVHSQNWVNRWPLVADLTSSPSPLHRGWGCLAQKVPFLSHKVGSLATSPYPEVTKGLSKIHPINTKKIPSLLLSGNSKGFSARNWARSYFLWKSQHHSELVIHSALLAWSSTRVKTVSFTSDVPRGSVRSG